MDRKTGSISSKMFYHFIFLLLLPCLQAQETGHVPADPLAGQVPPIHQAQVPAQQPAAQQPPVQQVPIQQPPAQQPPAQQVPMQQAPMQQVPMQQVPIQQVPMQQVPMQQVPMQQVHPGQVPMQQVHPGQVPMQQVHPGQVPMQQVHPGQVPMQQVHPGQVPMQQVHPGQAPVPLGTPQLPPGPARIPIPIPSSPVFDENKEGSHPAEAMEYKVHVDPGKEECYFQYVPKTATIYVSFQVLRGGDGMAGFAIRDPKGELVHPYQWKAGSEYQAVEPNGGYFGICVDNQFSRFAAKLVNIYITTFKYEEWEKFSSEWEDFNVSGENCTRILHGVDVRIQEILQHQQMSRSREARDFNLLLDNGVYVQYWSLAQCTVIVSAFVVQVYFVKRLFETNNGGRSKI